MVSSIPSTWHPSTTDTVSTRRALPSEALWIHRPPSVRQLFLAGTLSLSSTFDALETPALRAWQHLRKLEPIIGARARVDANGAAWLDLDVPVPEERLREWAERSMVVEKGWKGLDAVRGMWSDGGEDFAMVYLGLLGEGRVKFVVNFDHVITDGIGARVLVGQWLGLLAEEMGRGTEIDTDCKGNDGLPPVLTECVNSEQITEGKELEAAVERQWEFFVNDCVSFIYPAAILFHIKSRVYSSASSHLRPQISTASKFYLLWPSQT